ncbi:MAG: response regulator transcription factor [Planctomycetes bacterium]|nr:response regulator transcription factor [Planctomycetota bacterium]
MTIPQSAGQPRITHVLLADDHVPYRQRLRAFLDEVPDFEVVAEAGDGRTAIRLTRELNPDVVVMDVAMPELGGIEATRQIIEAYPAVKVLALSMHSERKFVESMLAAGASGYVLKENALDALAGAIRTVLGGGTYVCPSLTPCSSP